MRGIEEKGNIMQDQKLRDVLFGYGPEGLLGHIYNWQAESRDRALDAGEDKQAKYDGLVCSAIMKAIQEIRISDGRVRLMLTGNRIAFHPCNPC